MSDFDKEAEREKLREKYGEDDDETDTRRMSELLLKGATMTNGHCEECNDPLFRHNGQTFCATCQANGQQSPTTQQGDTDQPEPAQQTDGTQQHTEAAQQTEPGQQQTPAAQQQTADTQQPTNGAQPADERATADASQPPDQLSTPTQQPTQTRSPAADQPAAQQPTTQQPTTQQQTDATDTAPGALAGGRRSHHRSPVARRDDHPILSAGRQGRRSTPGEGTPCGRPRGRRNPACPRIRIAHCASFGHSLFGFIPSLVVAADDIPNFLGGDLADAVNCQQVVFPCGHHG
ncbi:MAG: Zn-finger containing protein, partial [uncultured archaeon A07HN63]